MLFQDIINNGHTDQVTFDTEIHEYTFSLSSNKEICGIGYQSQPEIASTPYIIEIFDNSANISIYSESHVFNSSKISYVSPTSTVSLQPGTSYTIKRIQTNWGTFITNTIGRLARKSEMTFPYSSGDMTINSANFYQNGGPLINSGIPYIDLIFE